jgi:protein TonB
MTPLLPLDVPASGFRFRDSNLLRYALVFLISALLHGGLWRFRHWLDVPADIPPQPKPPIEVILTPAPPLVSAPPLPAPVAEPVKPKPAPKAPPAPAPKPAPPAPRPVTKPARPPQPAPPPRLRPEVQQPTVEPPPKPVRPSRRELEDDPNLPASTPRERPVEPPPRPAPRPAPRSAPEPPPRPSATPPRPGTPGAAVAARPAPPAAGRAATASSATRAPAAAGGSAGGAYEGAKSNAAYLHNPKPDYPPLAKRRQWEGRVLLKVRVLANGTAAAVSVDTSSGHDLLDEAALEAVRQWHFVPAKRGGQPVDSWVNIPINFNLLDSP